LKKSAAVLCVPDTKKITNTQNQAPKKIFLAAFKLHQDFFVAKAIEKQQFSARHYLLAIQKYLF